MIGLGGAPVAFVMNRRKFESLSQAAQSIIRKNSGAPLSDHSTKKFDELDRQMLESLEADPGRTVVFPNAGDEKTIQAVYKDVIAQWVGSSDHNRELLARVRAELAKLRASE